MSNYTQDIVKSSVRAIKALSQPLVTQDYQNTIKQSLCDIAPVVCAGNFVTLMEEINKLTIEIIEHTEQYTTRDIARLTEEWSDNFFGLFYLMHGVHMPIEQVMDLTKPMTELFDSDTPFAQFFQASVFKTIAGYSIPENEHPMTAVYELQKTAKALSKYLRGKMNAQDMIPYFQNHFLALFALKLHFKLQKEDILYWMEQKKIRTDQRIQNNTIH